jgi:hypothetical protein
MVDVPETSEGHGEFQRHAGKGKPLCCGDGQAHSRRSDIVDSEKADWFRYWGFTGNAGDRIAGRSRIGTTVTLDAKRLISQIAGFLV